MIDVEPKHSNEFIRYGEEFMQFPKICRECDKDISKEKIYLCIFCDPICAYCERCGGPGK
jgi:hypothetical protein